MSTRSFEDGFYPASRARDIASGNGASDNDVLIEINQLQVLVDAAARGELLIVTVGQSPQANASPMTDVTTGPVYREAAFGTDASFASLFPGQSRKIYNVRMQRVIGYFTRLGYQVRREDQPTASPTTFNWVIRW
jgi:hypothetical protein